MKFYDRNYPAAGCQIRNQQAAVNPGRSCLAIITSLPVGKYKSSGDIVKNHPAARPGGS